MGYFRSEKKIFHFGYIPKCHSLIFISVYSIFNAFMICHFIYPNKTELFGQIWSNSREACADLAKLQRSVPRFGQPPEKGAQIWPNARGAGCADFAVTKPKIIYTPMTISE